MPSEQKSGTLSFQSLPLDMKVSRLPQTFKWKLVLILPSTVDFWVSMSTVHCSSQWDVTGGSQGRMAVPEKASFCLLSKKRTKKLSFRFFSPWMLILQFNGRKEIVKSIPFFGSNLDCVYDMNSFYHQKKLSNDLFVGTWPKFRDFGLAQK